MKTDELLRAVGVAGIVVSYIARLAFVGNGSIAFLSYSMAPMSLAVVAIVLLVSPEVLDRLPFGPTRAAEK